MMGYYETYLMGKAAGFFFVMIIFCVIAVIRARKGKPWIWFGIGALLQFMSLLGNQKKYDNFGLGELMRPLWRYYLVILIITAVLIVLVQKRAEKKEEKDRLKNGTEGLQYTMENGSYVITGYHGTETDVRIPDYYQNLPVTEIAAQAFEKSDIQFVTIGKNVSVIGKEAFKNATHLLVVSVGEGVRTIDGSAFEGCRLLSQVSFSENSFLENLETGAFQGCVSLEDIGLLKCSRLRKIGDGAFMNCKKITNLDIQHCSQLEIIGSSAFSGCTSMKKIEIPESIKEAGEYLFLGWSDAQEVIISGDPSVWKLYRDGKGSVNPFAKNENRTWMLLTKAHMTYKKEFSNHLLDQEEQHERLEKNIQAALDRETGHNSTYKILSREENEVMVLKDTVHFYQCTYKIQGQMDDVPVRKTYLAKVIASGSEYYADDWEITVENIDFV